MRKKFEYLTSEVRGNLHNLGKEGWELCSVNYDFFGGIGTFKREIIEEQPLEPLQSKCECKPLKGINQDCRVDDKWYTKAEFNKVHKLLLKDGFELMTKNFSSYKISFYYEKEKFFGFTETRYIKLHPDKLTVMEYNKI